MEGEVTTQSHLRHGVSVFLRVVTVVLLSIIGIVLGLVTERIREQSQIVTTRDSASQTTILPSAYDVEVKAPPFVPAQDAQTSASPVAPDSQSQKWILEYVPSTVYALRRISLYACPREECASIDMLSPGISWELPFTLKPDGWLYTSASSGLIGYVRAADLSASLPARCSLATPYRIAHIAERFTALGYTTPTIQEMALDAERQIEDAIGHDVLTYSDTAQSTVNLVITHYRDAEPYHRGLHVVEAGFPNGVVGEFWIGIYAMLIDDVDGWVADGQLDADERDTVIDNIIRKVILHELVHTIGFRHTDDPDTVMCGEPRCKPAAYNWREQMALTDEDREALVDWCNATE